MCKKGQIENASNSSGNRLEKRGGYQPSVQQGGSNPIPPQGGGQSSGGNKK